MMTEILLTLLRDALLAAVAAVGFSVISDPPLRTVPFCALLAACGHAVRFLLMHNAGMDIMTASFLGALTIGTLCVGVAYVVHCPTTTLYIPALLPMIPGMYAYRTVFAMTHFMQNLNDEAMAMQSMLEVFTNGMVTLLVIFALAVGASLPTLILHNRCLQMTRQRAPKRGNR